jgi:hypothetical protein
MATLRQHLAFGQVLAQVVLCRYLVSPPAFGATANDVRPNGRNTSPADPPKMPNALLRQRKLWISLMFKMPACPQTAFNYLGSQYAGRPFISVRSHVALH